MRRGKLILRMAGGLAALLVAAAALLIWGPYLAHAHSPAPRAKFVGSLGENGPGKLRQPIGVAVAENGEVFVSSSGEHRIVVFGPDGEYRRAFGKEGTGTAQLERPMHLSFGPDHLLYVTEYLNDRVSVFRPEGTFMRHLTAPGFDAPAGVVVDAKGTVYVANFYGHEILVLSPDGDLVAKWGKPGRIWRGQLHYPTDVAIARDGALWVADAYNSRLQRLVDGRATAMAGWGLGLRVFGFRVATGVGVDQLGRVYGADFGHGTIRVFDGGGTPLETFGRAGRGPGEFDRPEGVAVQGARIYITDFGNDRVQQWRMEEGAR